ncbi:MAG TPA: RNA polymerase sigma factor region1.1 domain-containing protein, partial [Burkholderiales bacterium]|nr:RNA polymerase sigma factor region1.1 domain-containing protein [Burkholderiales bacterium]
MLYLLGLMARELEKPLNLADDVEARRTQLKSLIALGKERGYLTYAEINDHLPDDMLDAEQLEAVISMINDMGIACYDEAPDVEALLMAEAPAQVPDEDVAEEAEAALSSVDSEFGRTTDPVRMYMREMGSVELLTREGEIEIAKRIEDGLKHMIQAISACPTTIAEILELADRIERTELRVDEVVDGLVDLDSDEMMGEPMAEEPEEEDLQAEGDEDSLNSASYLELRSKALGKFATIGALYHRMAKALARGGPRSRAYQELQQQISTQLMGIRFSARQVEALCDKLRKLVDQVRQYEREIMELCVNKAGMPRAHFIKSFPGNEGNLKWVSHEVAAKKAYSVALARYEPAIVEQQQALLDLQQRVGIPLKDLKEINRQMSTGEAKARRAKREMTEA